MGYLGQFKRCVRGRSQLSTDLLISTESTNLGGGRGAEAS